MRKYSFFKRTGYLLKETWIEFISDNVIQCSASLSFYTIFSIPPLLIIIITLSGIFFGDKAVNGEVFDRISGVVGTHAALQIQESIKYVKLSGHNTWVTTIGVIVLIVGASSVFSEIQESINFLWGIKTRQKRGLIKFIVNRLMSFILIFSVGILFLIGLIASSLLDFLNKELIVSLPQYSINLFYSVNILIFFIIIILLFITIFKTLPDGKIAWIDCLVGAVFTAILFMIGKFVIGAYLSSTSYLSIYGAVGSVILILAWIYYSSMILYFGAEFTKVYAYHHGNKIIPNRHSVQFKKEKVEIGPGRSYKH